MAEHVLSERAEADLREIWNYISQDSSQGADRVIDSIVDRFPLLAEQPYIGRARSEIDPGLRSYVVRPYIIFYYPRDYGVEIARVVHGSRRISNIFR